MTSKSSLQWYEGIVPSDLDDLKIDFAVAVERAMQSAGKTKSELARELKVSPARITQALRGDANLTMEVMHNIASALNHKVHVHLAPIGVQVRTFGIISKVNTVQSNQPLVASRNIPLTKYTRLDNPTEILEAA